MRRFAFTRSKCRSSLSSELNKDLYDPDQRPITISSYQKSKNRTMIIKPRIFTSNLVDSRSSIPNNFPIHTYNNNINLDDMNEETDFYNVNQFSQRSTNLNETDFYNTNQRTANISSKDYVMVPLPSYFNSEDLSNSFDEDNRNYSNYSPPEIRSPTSSRFNVISRFIATSQKIDRSGQSYSSQANRTMSRNQSRITTVDTYNEIAKKTFKQNSNGNEDDDEKEKKEFLAQYLLDHTKHENAKIIQKAFRLARNRNHFNRFIRINMSINHDLKKLTFNLWRLTVVNKTEELIKIFYEIKKLYNFICRHFKTRELSPFRLFYVTQQLFIPKDYTAEDIYKFFYLMHLNALSRVFRVWAFYTKKSIQHRTTLISQRFAGKKFSCFGFIYHIFVNWHRLTLWRVESRSNTKKKFITLNKLNKHEVNVFWNVREHILNVKRTRIKRATEFSKKRVAAKAVRALYNRSIEATSEKAIIETSDMFRNIHLQSLAHRAWLKYMQKRLQELQVLRDVMHAWYGRVYLTALKKLLIELAEKLYYDHFITSIMNAWFRQARERRIRKVAMSLRIHKKPSSMFFVIFALLNDFELAFHIFCFRMWIRYTRTRKKWHFFVKWCMQANLDGSDKNNKLVSPIAEKERKIIVLSDLRRAAHLKIIKRGCTATTNFLPRHTWKSLELTYNALHEINFIQNHRTLDLNSKTTKNKKIFIDESEAKTWDFLTEKIPNQKENESESKCLDFSLQTLVRCFVLKLQKQENYELSKVKDTFFDQKVNPEFVELRTLSQLEDQSRLNISILRKHLLEKVRRDHATLASLMSHISAKRIQSDIKDFSVTCYDKNENENIKSSYIKCDNYNSMRTESNLSIAAVFVYPEVNESIDFLIRENEQAPNRITSMFEMTKNQVLIDFQCRLRDPNYFALGTASSDFAIQDMNDVKPSKLGDSKVNESKKTILSITSLDTGNNSDESIELLDPSGVSSRSSLGSRISLSSFSNFSMLNLGSTSNLGSSFNLASNAVNNSKKLLKQPIKNALIDAYVKPISKDKEQDGLMSLVENQSQKNLVAAAFTIDNLKKVLDRLQTTEYITQSLAVFFQNVCQIQLDLSEIKSISNPDDLLPKPEINIARKKIAAKKSKKKINKNGSISVIENSSSFQDEFDDSNDVEVIIQTKRHVMQKNMNIFIAEINGLQSLDRIPLKLIASPIAAQCVSSIFTIFNALKKTSSLAQYLDLTPFSTKLKSNDELLISTQEKAWNALKGMFPKIELPTESSSIMNISSFQRRKSVFSSSFFTIGSIQNVDDIMSSNDAFLACYLLPYIFSFDLVIDFIKDEMKPIDTRK